VARALGGRFVTVPRSELSSLIFDRITGKIETRFGDSITKIEEADGHVRASFHSGYVRNFDLVIGADGLHSGVRTLAFGPELKFERHLGYLVAAFETDGYRPRDELAYVLHTDVGWQVARFAMREDRTLFLFVFADDPENPAIPQELSAQKDLLHERFASGEWECPRILEALDRTTELYFDRVSQIQMGTSPGCWHRGRVALVGDAASCVSFLAGQGAALAMVAAYLLAGELHAAGGDYTRAFERYEARFGPFVASKQRAALRFAGAFVPRSALSLFLRDRIMNAMSIPWIAKFAMGRGLVDKIELPDYADNDTSPPIKR
jgi:2-polyprenyl-6-methoxyphenol hydroxylase-like FAD-dependent oxidoreductase